LAQRSVFSIRIRSPLVAGRRAPVQKETDVAKTTHFGVGVALATIVMIASAVRSLWLYPLS
jgi:hypothetical protein